MKLVATELLKLAPKEVWNGELLPETVVTGVSTDSRTVQNGDVFIALKGETFDGHAFAADAVARGAVAVVVEDLRGAAESVRVPVVIVSDTVNTLGTLAHLYRKKFSIPFLAIGGSNGKTTTKEMTAAVLAMEYNVLSTQGNLNNHIGVARTLFRLEKSHDIAVVEIGTNHPGEIEYLCSILCPTHGLLTNIGREHLEFFRSVDGAADEEGMLFESLRERKSAIAIVNADDARVVSCAKKVKRRRSYGFTSPKAEIKGKRLHVDPDGCAGFQLAGRGITGKTSIQLAVPGEHNARNALAAAAVGMTFKVPVRKIKEALESVRVIDKRMEVLYLNGVRVFNDTYNANPDSMMAAVRTLAQTEVQGKRIAVLADMRELGIHGIEEHERLGSEVARLGIEYLFTYGELARHIHAAAGVPFAVHYDQKNMLAEYLAELVLPGDAVLVKGSRGMKMEDVVTFLLQRLHTAAVPSR